MCQYQRYQHEFYSRFDQKGDLPVLNVANDWQIPQAAAQIKKRDPYQFISIISYLIMMFVGVNLNMLSEEVNMSHGEWIM